MSFCKGTDCGRVMFSEMHCCKLVFVFGFFLPFFGEPFLAAGNIIFNALVSFCKGAVCGRVICSEMHCCKLVFVFGSFLAFLA